MPTYEYECEKCKYKFDHFQSMSAKHLTKCPECGGKVTRLLGTGAGIIFKGSGFYQTDYKNSSVSARNSVPSEARDKKSSAIPKSCDKPKADGCKGCPKHKD